MQLFVVGVVLLAALIHAAWNALVKTGSDIVLTTALVTTAAACFAAVAPPFLPPPAAASWPYIAGSVVLQFAYYTLRSYALWLFLLIGCVRLLWTCLWRGRELFRYLRQRWWQGLAGGGTLAAYRG